VLYAYIQLSYVRKFLVNFILAGLYIAIGYNLLYLWLFRVQVIYEVPLLIFTDLPFALFAMPLFYLYIIYLIGDTSKISLKSLLHFLPGLISLVAVIAYNNVSGAVIETVFLHPSEFRYHHRSILVNAISWCARISFIVYSVIEIVKLKGVVTGKNIKEHKEFKVLMFFIIVGVINSCMLVFAHLIRNYLLLIFVGLIYGLLGVLHIVFNVKYPEFSQRVEKTARKIRYENAIRKEINIEIVVSRIRELLEEEKIFRDATMSLQAISTMLKLPPRQVSGIIHKNMKANFQDLINDYRIEEARSLLSNCPEMNILEIVRRVGFSSKTAFSALFIKKYNLSPGEYRKSGNQAVS